ncbi:ATP-binding cassette, subfamily B [Caldanaerobius fijiensis DSM 17918]|uniref:ATP-binding cassette, subfamily B n=1 Tax=Caldanaerobius fijiensis DSM 17918 TaxID=1121256 RepID=A0A1M4VMN0_9THEO|nr:ABC transporter ATP-binding protein [Caldanaerobius fijiensis]SHE70112.1 ATP-binding cassette, subfamily B [Caldanaerobius fijiensis DSM 17918]
MREYLVLKNFFIRHKWPYIIGAISLIMLDFVQAYIPRLMGNITDGLKNRTMPYDQLIKYVFTVLAMAIIIFVLRYFWRMGFMGTARWLEYEMRRDLFSHLLILSPDYYNHHKTGDLMAHATNDIQAVRMSIARGMTNLMDTIVLFTTSLIIVVKTINLKLALVGLIPGPFMFIIVVIFGRKIRERFRRVQEAFANMTDKAEENIMGIRVVKSYVQEKGEIKKFDKANMQNFEANMAMVRLSSIFGSSMQILSAISTVIVIIYGGTLVINKTITLGDFVAFNSYIGMLLGPLTSLGWVVNIFQRGSASMKRINTIMRTKPEIVDSPDVVDVKELKGDIKIQNLTFKYAEDLEPALKDINIEIKMGKTLAVVGRTGCGKSTLANLLLHLYKVPEGTIFIDGIDINKIPLKTLRENIGYVPQDTFLFSSTIKENIAFSPDDIPLEKIQYAAKLAGIHDEIMGFKDGYDTVLGERGVTLSGGQKQRTAIARAVLKNPNILILDDCLSAVDAQTEEQILRNLKEFMKNRTSIIISHRISAVKDADEIIVLDEGKIVQRGTHEELLATEGFYKELYKMQQLEENINTEE